MSGTFFSVDAILVGSDKLRKKIDDLEKAATKGEGVFKALAAGGLMIQGTAVKSIQATSPGSTTATRYNPKRTVRVSPPGQPPNSDTGVLAKSIRLVLDRQNLTVFVGTGVNYGAWLEFGTLTMAPRPWLGPAFDTHRDQIVAMVEKAVKDTLK